MRYNYLVLIVTLVLGFQSALYCDSAESFEFGDFEQLQAIDYELSSRLNGSRDSLWLHVFRLCLLSGVVHTVGVTSLQDLATVWTERRWARMTWLAACGAVGLHELFGMYEDVQAMIEFAGYRAAIQGQIDGFSHAQMLINDMDDIDFSEEVAV